MNCAFGAKPLRCLLGGFPLQMARSAIQGRLRAGALAGMLALMLVATGLATAASPRGSGGTGAGSGHHHGHHRHGARGARRAPRRPGSVDLVARPLERRERQRDRQAGARLRHRHGLHQELGQHERVEPVHAGARQRSPRARARRLRLAVRLRQPPQRRGEAGHQGEGRRRRLPDDRRRGRVRGPLRRRKHLHAQAAPRSRLATSRSRWRAFRGTTTTPGFPTRSSSAPARRSTTRRRCTGRRSGPRLRTASSTCSSRTASTAGRSSRSARRTTTRRRASSPRSATSRSPTGSPAYSWWSWQATKPSEWKLLGRPNHRAHGFKKTKVYPVLHRGSAGDPVIWAQEHLIGAGENLGVDGRFGAHTKIAVEDFQSRHDITPTGTIGPLTWKALLQVKPVRIDWSKPRKTLTKAETPPGGEPASASHARGPQRDPRAPAARLSRTALVLGRWRITASWRRSS